ncbi:MAG TPA: tetratricopeptide repeat protein, partial [Stenomitos sp.]
MTNQLDATRSSFIEENRQEFAELLTFIDFAEGLTIGFVEVNQEADKATLADALREAFKSSSIQLEVFNFSREQDLRFLREALIERVAQIRTDKKLVLFIQGLEAAIGNDRVGAYPPILQDLNFVRDSYRQSVPYPLLFVLPDYAITRVSLYAPDFWAWRSGVFTFKTSAESRKQLQTQAFEQPSSRVASSENQAQIEQLKQFLMELHPSGHPLVEQNVQLCREVYYKLGSAYLTQHQPEKARDYLHEGLKLTERYPDPVLTLSLYRKLGNAYEDMRQFEQAIDTYNRMLKIAQSVNREDWCSTALHDLGNVALEQRQFEQAKVFYHQSLAIAETLKNRYNQASTYPQLGRVAQKLREFEQARLYYQQALDIFIEFGDRYNQASTYH